MNALSWLKNAGKSFGYATIDVLKTENTGIIKLASNAKDLGDDLYESIKDFKASVSSKEKNEGNIIKDSIDVTKDTIKNLLADIKTGNFYNQARKTQAEEEQMNAFFGGDFNFDDDFGDFDFDFDNDEKSSVEDEFKSSKVITQAMDIVGGKTAAAISSATVQSADYIVKNNRSSSRAIYSLTSRGFGEITKGLAAVNASINSINQIAEPLTNHMKNSYTFFNRSEEFYKQSLDYLKKISENTTPISEKKRSGYRGSSNRTTIEYLMSDGVLDFRAYKDMIVSNIKSTTDIFTSMLGMVGGVKGAASDFTSSPTAMLPIMLIKSLMGKKTIKAMNEFNKTLEGFFTAGISSLSSVSLGNGIIGNIWDLVKDIFVPDSTYKSTLNPSGYEKGKIDWDGVSKKAITEVIPTQLGKILSAITGEEEKRFDYNSGKWVKVSSIKTNFERYKRSQARMNGGDYIDYLNNLANIMARDNNMDPKQLEKLKQEIENYNYNSLFSNSDDFKNIMKDNFNYSRYGLSKDGWEFIRRANRLADEQKKYSGRTQWAGGIYTGRNNYGNSLRYKEADGTDMAIQLFNDSIDETERSSTILGRDKYKNDIFFYLQGIYQYSKHLSDNLPLLVGGGRGKGGKIKGTSIPTSGKITPIQAITLNEAESSFNNINSYPPNAGYTNSNYIISSDMAENALKEGGQFEQTTLSKMPRDLREYYLNKQSGGPIDEEKENQLNEFFKRNNIEESTLKIANNAKSKISNNSAVKSLTNALGRFFKVPADMITDILNAAQVSMKRVIYGEKSDNGETGLMQYLGQGLKSVFDKINENLDKTYYGRMAKDLSKNLAEKLFGTKGEDGKRSGGKFSGFVNDTTDSLKGAWDWVKSAFVGTAANGRKVTKSGIISVSEGELIIPAEYNPFYKKKVDKKKQYKTEFDNAMKFYGLYADGGTTKEDDTDYYDKIKNAKGFTGKTKEFAKAGLHGLGQFGDKFIKYLFPQSKKDQEKEKKGIFSRLSEAIDADFGAAKGGLGAGAIIGGGVSLLTGLMGGPLLGAAVGAATGFTIKSKKVQELLFGKDDDPGIMGKKISDLVKKNVPTMAKSGTIGATAGLLLGSPITGAVIGSAIGYAQSSDKVKDYLFGKMEVDANGKNIGRKGGFFSKNFQQAVKKRMPNIAAGTLAGIVAGPFGIVGNAILGSTIGYLSASDKFKQMLFGKEDKDGKKHGGLLGMVKDKIIDPVAGIFFKLAEELKVHTRNTFHYTTKIIRKMATGFFKKGVSRLEKTKAGKVITGIGKGLGKAGFNLITSPARLLNYGLEGRALRHGYSIRDVKLGRNMTAEERASARGRHPIKFLRDNFVEGRYAQIDDLLASMDQEQLNNFNENISSLFDTGKYYEDNIRKSRANTREALYNSQYINRHSVMAMINKKDFKHARELVQTDLSSNTNSGITPELAKKLLKEIDTQEKMYQGKDNAKKNRKDAKREIIQQTGMGKLLNKFGINYDQLTDADIRNIQDLIKDEQVRFENEISPEEKKKEDTFNRINHIDDILINIRDILARKPGSTEPIKDENGEVIEQENSSGSDSENSSSVVNQATEAAQSAINNGSNLLNDGGDDGAKEGDVKYDDQGRKLIYRKNGDGWQFDTTDRDTKDSVENEQETDNAIKTLPLINQTINGLGSKLGAFGKLLYNKDDKEKPGLFQKLMSFLGGDEDSKFSLLNIIKKGATIAIQGGLLWAVASGKFDDIGKALGFGNKDNATVTSGLKKQDMQGNNISQGEDGNWYYDDGTQYSGKQYLQSSNYATATAPLSSRFATNEVRQVLMNNGSSLTTKYLAKVPVVRTIQNKAMNAISKRANTTLLKWSTDNLAKKGIQTTIVSGGKNLGKAMFNNVAEKGIESASKVVVKNTSNEGLQFFVKHLDDIPISKNVIQNIDKKGLFDTLSEKINKSIASKSSEALAKTGAQNCPIPVVALIVRVATFVADFTSGWQDARTTFGITKDPSVGLKIVSGLLKALTGQIPYIGGLIPNNLLVDVFIDYVAPALGIKATELRQMRDEAKQEVEAYNEAHGTNYTVADYNKNVLQDYTWDEKLINTAKDGISYGWDTGKTIVNKIANGQYKNGLIKGIYEDAADAYNKYIYDKTVKNIEADIRKSMNKYENSVDENEVKNRVALAIEIWLNSSGKQFYKYYYGYEYNERKAEEFKKKLAEYSSTDSGKFSVYAATHTNEDYVETYNNEDYQAIANKIDNATYGNKGNKSTSINYKAMAEKITASNDSASGGASGIFMQQSNFGNAKLGNKSASEYGCGPAAAIMAINQATGKNISANNALSIAQKYQNGNGTDIKYFDDMYRRNGMSTKYYDTSSSDMVSDIRSGKPVVLLGQDSSNSSKSNSPFGPNSHYVVTSGIDKNGNIIIKDPESNKPKAYSSKILRSVKAAIGGIKNAYHKANLRRAGLSGGDSNITVKDCTNTQAAWAFFTKVCKYTPEAAAAIMGNLRVESGADFNTTIQGDNGAAIGICQWHNYKNKNGRFLQLVEFAERIGMNWEHIEAQLRFIHYEIFGFDIYDVINKYSNIQGMPDSEKEKANKQALKDAYSKNKGSEYNSFSKYGGALSFIAGTDIEKLATIFAKAYERPLHSGNSDYTCPNRVSAAQQYYDMYNGKNLNYNNIRDIMNGVTTPVLSTSVNSSYSNELNDDSSDGGILSRILGAFGKIGEALNGTLSGDSSNSDSSSSSSGSWDNSANQWDTTQIQPGMSPVDIMRTIKGSLSYSMKGDRNPEKGNADCSSTIRWAIRKATNDNIDIGGNTSAQYSSPFLMDVAYNNGNEITKLPDNIQENDLLFYRRMKDYTKGRKDRIGHIEMYNGNGEMIGHGGPGYGPTIKNATTKQLMKVSRVVGLDNYLTFAKQTAGDTIPVNSIDMSNGGQGDGGDTNGSSLSINSQGSIAEGANNIVGNINNNLSGKGSGLLKSHRLLLANRNNNKTKQTSIIQMKPILSGGASTIKPSGILNNSKKYTKSTPISNINNPYGISKETALMLKTIITLIESIVTNTSNINGIYDTLISMYKTMGGQNNAQTAAAMEALSRNKNNTDYIEQSVASIKQSVDAILAS